VRAQAIEDRQVQPASPLAHFEVAAIHLHA
jgi:hypothetical protein